MRESIQVQQIRCERCVARVSSALAPLKSIRDARVEMGTSSLVLDYDDGAREEIDAAITGAGFTIMNRTELPVATP